MNINMTIAKYREEIVNAKKEIMAIKFTPYNKRTVDMVKKEREAKKIISFNLIKIQKILKEEGKI